jgi:hypothetical protein
MRMQPPGPDSFRECRSAFPTHDKLAQKIGALCERFRGELQGFIHTRRYKRALSWEHELAGFLQLWRQRGIRLGHREQETLRKLLADLRTRLVPADQLRALREDAIKIAACIAPGPARSSWANQNRRKRRRFRSACVNSATASCGGTRPIVG